MRSSHRNKHLIGTQKFSSKENLHNEKTERKGEVFMELNEAARFCSQKKFASGRGEKSSSAGEIHIEVTNIQEFSKTVASL